MSYEKLYSFDNVLDYQDLHIHLWNKYKLNKKQARLFNKTSEWNDQETARLAGYDFYDEYLIDNMYLK